MNIAIHCEPAEGTLGGAEFAAATLAHALSTEHHVRLLHHRAELTGETLAAFTSLDLSHVETRYVAPTGNDAWSCSATGNPVARFARARDWQSDLSRGSDLFINFTHGVPPFCHARAGLLIVLFPLFRRPSSWPWADAGDTPAWKRTTRRAYYDWEWTRRMNSYGARVSISEFTRQWTTRWWGASTSVLYPPVDIAFPVGPKRNLILSVGRFGTTGVNKRQFEMVRHFAGIGPGDLPGWTYVSEGALGSTPADRAYFERVRNAASPDCVVRANVPREELKRDCGAAKIFWHAAGYGDSGDVSPEMSEHFGMATVEAMAAGCVPVVINSGGQREIVTHGVDGFLWNTLDELRTFTQTVANDEPLRRRLSTQARLRARAFSTSAFLYQIDTLIGHLSAG